MNPTAQRFQDRAHRFGEIIDAVDGQWDSATPCDDWSVRDVINHAMETERDFLDRQGLDLAPGSDIADPADPADPAEAWRAHTAAMVDVLGRDGVAETTFDGYFGPTTVADTMADFYGWDLVIHGWDIARATDQDWTIDEDEVERLNRTADGWGDALHSEGVCAPEVALPDDAPAQDRLLARLGRDPQWRAAQPTH